MSQSTMHLVIARKLCSTTGFGQRCVENIIECDQRLSIIDVFIDVMFNMHWWERERAYLAKKIVYNVWRPLGQYTYCIIL